MSKENFKPTADMDEIEKSQEKKDNLEKAKKLTVFCSENENPILIIDYGENFDLKKIDLEQSDLAKLSLEISKHYISGPIFTDTFSKDNNRRRKWEKKTEGLMDAEIEKYYKSNRLGVNNYFNVIGILDVLLNDLKDSEIKNKLIDIKNEIFQETGDLINKKDDSLIYGTLEDDNKIELIKKFSKIVQKLISILENKRH
ncbi:MAG: hypothetical protein AAB493_02655 [Patescibacteria group bacterium]